MSNLLGHPYDLLTKEQIETSVKARAARVNALKSTGPRTSEGKAVSARNAFKHGFAGAKLTIDETEEVAFNDHLDAYFLRFKPQDQVEADSVRRTAEAQWKMDTINATENAIMSLEGGFQMVLADAKLDPEQITIHHYRALALIEQSEGRAIDLCHRYYVSAAREYDRALRTFYRLRDERDKDAAAAFVPELIVASSQPDPEPQPEPDPEPQQNQEVPNEPNSNNSSNNRKRSTTTTLAFPQKPVRSLPPLQLLPPTKAAA